ncbi:MAG: hypothetical protein AAFQ91_32635 [Cyanobacteria bacterium J06621_15]
MFSKNPFVTVGVRNVGSNNCVSVEFLEQVEQLSAHDCELIANFQEEIVDRGIGVSRYLALYE